jgi:hypothetical protein
MPLNFPLQFFSASIWTKTRLVHTLYLNVKLRKCQINWHLVSALLIRWSLEDHTFHLPSGPATITLQDVSMLFDLSISGRPVTGASNTGYDQVPRLLGCHMPPKVHGNALTLGWLEKYLKQMPDNPTQEQLMCHLRAYLLYFFGKFLLPDTSGDRINTMYLPLLEDINTIKSYSWGSACLASLYRGLCDVVTSTSANPTFGGCVLLIQAWAHCRIRIIQRHRSRDPPHNRPLALWYVYTIY